MTGHARISGLTSVALASLLSFFLARPTSAHEPLWGETPTIFGPGVYHPEIRIGFLRKGSASDPGGERTESFDQEFGMQYGINRFVNVRLRIPVTRTEIGTNLAGQVEKGTISGVGDLLLEAKYRFHLVQATGLQRSQTAIVGWKLPTGADDRTAPEGARLEPAGQPGSGRQGFLLGYAFDRETLRDTFWTSAVWTRDLGGDFRRGDTVEVDAAYGWWMVRPNMAEELGINLALGVHADLVGSDRLEDGGGADNDHRVAAVHLTPILTKGRSQIRVGILAPFLKRGNEAETDFRYEIRGGWEMFF